MEEALHSESITLLTDMVVYLRGSGISTWEQEQVRRDMTQTLLDAQARGDQPEDVIYSEKAGQENATFLSGSLWPFPHVAPDR